MADLVIFDCDGVLIDSEVISARMLIAELAGLGVVVDMAYVASHFLGRSYPTVMATIRQDFGLDLPGSFEDAYRTRLLAAFERELQVMPHVAQALRALRDLLSAGYYLLDLEDGRVSLSVAPVGSYVDT